MIDVNIKCSRCGLYKSGSMLVDQSIIKLTSGFYILSAYWGKYAKPGEQVLCDGCMAADPGYQKDYPK